MKRFLSIAVVCLLGTRSAEASVPTGQEQLNRWWKASKSMWLGQDAYEAKGTTFSDGQCSTTFNDGIIIPVYTGKPPLSERVVGVIFVGQGELSMDFERRADAWAFANHMVMKGEKTVEEMQPIAREGASYSVGITRAMILGADPMVERILLNRMPVGSGVFRSESKDGVNEEYIVTESRGKARAKMISTNLLPQRTLRLEQAGLDANQLRDRVTSDAGAQKIFAYLLSKLVMRFEKFERRREWMVRMLNDELDDIALPCIEGTEDPWEFSESAFTKIFRRYGVDESSNTQNPIMDRAYELIWKQHDAKGISVASKFLKGLDAQRKSRS